MFAVAANRKQTQRGGRGGSRLPPLVPPRSQSSMAALGGDSGSAIPTPYGVNTEALMNATASRELLGDLLIEAGVLPRSPVANRHNVAAATNTNTLRPATLLSSWTSNVNRSTLAAFLGYESNEPAVPPTVAAPLPPIAKQTFVTAPKKSGKPPQFLGNVDAPKHATKGSNAPVAAPESESQAELQAALARVQETLRGVQLMQRGLVAHVDHRTHEGHGADRTEADSPGPSAEWKDAKDMTKVELWRHKHRQLPENVQTPTFDHEEQIRYVPKGYIDRKVYDIRLDPDRWFELKDRVARLEKRNPHDMSIIRRNRDDAAMLSPARHQEEGSVRKERLVERLVTASVRRSELEAERLASIRTNEERMRIRHGKQAEQLVVFVALGARLGRMWGAMMSQRESRLRASQHSAAVVIQKGVRLHLFHIKELSPVRAFLLRARMIRRFVTRMRVRVLLPKYADMVRKFLQSVRFETRILMAFRRLHDRVVGAQRLVRRWLDDKRFLRSIRSMQFQKCVAKRIRDFALMATKGSSLERDLAAKELEDLSAITPAFESEILERFRTDTRAAFHEAMRAYSDARRNVLKAQDARTAALLRKLVPVKPHIRILIPSEQMERMVRNASREVRLQRSLQ